MIIDSQIEVESVGTEFDYISYPLAKDTIHI